MRSTTVPSAFGLFFTSWMFDAPLILSGAITTASIIGLMVLPRRDALTAARLSWSGALYIMFEAGLILLRQR